MCKVDIMTITSILLKLEESEKERWRKYAKKHYRNNLTRMIQVAVNQMIERGHDNIETNFDDSKIINVINQSNSELKDQLNRIEDILNREPGLPLGVYVQSLLEQKQDENKKERGLKYDF
jgi:hypothetical protein